MKLLVPLLASALVTCTTLAEPPGRVLSREVVFHYDKDDPYDRTNLYGFNHAASVAHLGGNRVIAAWFSGPYEASVHQVILHAISDDGGRTWQPANVFHDAPQDSDFDPSFIELPDATLAFFSVGRWNRYPFVGFRDAERKRVGTESFLIYMCKTTDGGKTWTKPKPPLVAPGWNCRSNGIRLSTGELLLPLHYLKGPYKGAVLISKDDGKTWTRSPEIDTPKGVGAAEPSIAECSDGSLLMVLRTRNGELWTTRSTDRGQTWSDPTGTDLPAGSASHNLFRTSTGKLVLTHNPTEPPLRTELTMRVSEDDGHTWSEPLQIAKVPAAGDDEEVFGRQVSYPSVCELPDGTLLVVWGRIELSPSRQQGIVHSARVALN